VYSERKHVEELRYIHRNPVKRGLVPSPELWRFRYYWLGEKGPVKVRELRLMFPARSAQSVQIKKTHPRAGPQNQ